MPLFEFKDTTLLLGTVREVDTRKVSIHVKTDSDLRKARVGQLVCLEVASAAELWLVGLIDKVIKSVAISTSVEAETAEEIDLEGPSEEVINTVRLTLVGTARWDANQHKNTFSRSIGQVPDIEAKCYVLQEKQLEAFMNILIVSGDKAQSLALGQYTIDDAATAYLDGNKFFQRHAALLGSTGSGKSWTVASILERAAKLPTANLVVFDLHGEYRQMSYARHLRIPGPEELGSSSNELLYLPYWLLNAEEMQAMFIDRTEFSAHNQVMVFQDAVIAEKKATLNQLGKTEVLNAFTLDSPIPFSINNVIRALTDLNEERVQGARGLRNGDDQSTVKKLMPESLESLLDVLPVMDIGEALVVGDAVLLPSRVKITEPKEKPLSATIDFWTEWQQEAAEPDFEQAVENMRKQGRS